MSRPLVWRPSPAVLATLAGVLIVAWQWALGRPLWLDEEMIAVNLRDRSYAGLAGRLWLDQSAPLGWLVLQRFVLVTFGSSESALRAVPALFGAATIIAAFCIGQRWLTTFASTVFLLLCSSGQWISFYVGELKPYSADTFFGLALPALAVSAAETSSSEAHRKGIVLWAAAAAIGHWFSLGALLVLPACGVVLALSARRNSDAVRRLALAAAVVTVSVAVHYLLSIRYTQSSESLQRFWQFAFPPQEAGIAGTLRWLYSQLEPFALKPGGSGQAAAFWIAIALGLLVAPARWLALVAGLVGASGFALAAFRVMPLYERLSLWFVPALYLAIALFADRAVWLIRHKSTRYQWMRSAAAAASAVIVVWVCGDIVDRGIQDLRGGRPADTNRATDDRGGVAWLMQQRQPGDVLITTHHAQPAIWWYGGVSLSTHGREFADGGRVLVAEHKSGQTCRDREVETVLDGRARIQVYLGFVDVPEGFDDLLLERLSKLGTITARQFGGASRAAVIDPATPGGSNLFWRTDAGKATGTWLDGCIALRPAQAW